jgi:uncharacterized membrane protein
MEKFSKYIGVQGIIALLLIVGYIITACLMIDLPQEYTYFTALVLGFYFAKNGVGIIDAIRGTSKKTVVQPTVTRED